MVGPNGAEDYSVKVKFGDGVFYDANAQNNTVYAGQPTIPGTNAVLAGIVYYQESIGNSTPIGGEYVTPMQKANIVDSGYLEYSVAEDLDGNEYTIENAKVGDKLLINYEDGKACFSPTLDAAFVEAGVITTVNNDTESFTVCLNFLGKEGSGGGGGSGAVDSVNGKTGRVILYADDINFADGESFQEKLDAGELKGQDGTDGTNGTNGTDGSDATINGVNTLNIVEGENVTIDQTGSTLTISSTGGSGGGIDDAPVDGKQYGRQNAKWTEITGAAPPADLFNMIPDPHFEFGNAIVTDGVYPKLQPSSNASANVENGILSITNTQTNAKGFQCWAELPLGWADKFNVVVGSKVTIGCYMKIVPGDRDTFVPMQWGAIEWNGAKPDGANPYTPGSQTQTDPATFPYDDFVWFQWTVTMREGSGVADINAPVIFGLAYLQCQDPGATSVNPTTIQIKEPCIIMNATGDEQGFYESYRTDEYLNPEVLKVDSLQMETLSADSIVGLTEVDTELVNTGRVELKDNFSFPTDGTFIGKFDQEVVVSELGVQLPLVSRPYTQAEWDALTEAEKSLIEIADVYDAGGTQVAISNPVYTLTEWNALTQEQKDSIEIADVVEG